MDYSVCRPLGPSCRETKPNIFPLQVAAAPFYVFRFQVTGTRVFRLKPQYRTVIEVPIKSERDTNFA